ncbi:MAG TPA: dethiobiotin synthase [Candidatus Desulfobacillus sp.]|mgnify:CR=1 FL=1|nr:dethiobiotin synthase [Candidatus Desulfobacillus sp.]
MKQAYFLTGTDTGVGKTLIATGLLHAARSSWDMRVLGMKPVVAGSPGDLEKLIAASNVEAPRNYINPYYLEEPVSPNIAAKGVGQTIDIDHIKYCFDEVRGLADFVIVEGIGGFRAPLNETQDISHLAKLLALPVILVVGLKLGCLSQTLLAIESIKARGLQLAGWVANQVDPDMICVAENVGTLKERVSEPLLGFIRYRENAKGEDLIKHLAMPE